MDRKIVAFAQMTFHACLSSLTQTKTATHYCFTIISSAFKTIIKSHLISAEVWNDQAVFLPGFEFFETSAKDNINVKQTFERLVDIICDKMSESLETDPAITAAKQNTRLKETPPPPQPNCGC